MKAEELERETERGRSEMEILSWRGRRREKDQRGRSEMEI